MNFCNYCRAVILLLFGTALFFSHGIFADQLNDAIATGTAINQAAAKSQQMIDQVSNETRRMLDEYRQVTRETETLKSYNEHLRQLLVSQQQEKQSMLRQLQEIQVTQREIVPLTLRMLETLETFVTLDIPFLLEERRKRIDRLKKMVVRADVTDAEKYRRIVEAYQIENDYGRTIEAYRADLTANGASRPVDFLRLGRVALLYQTLDGSETGVWNRVKKNWEVLPGNYQKPIRNGLRIARKEAAPDLLLLPIPAPEAAK